MCTLRQIDAQKTEAFAGELLDLLNNGASGLMTSIGHRSGLFDTMSQLSPSTSEQMAAAATKLNEGHVREGNKPDFVF